MKIKIPKLKRWQKVLRNVSLSIILILLIFISIDFRWLTSDLAFENLTKAYLIDDYDIIATFKEEIQGIQKGEKAYLAETSDYYLYGTVYKNGLLWEERQLFLNKKEPYVLISLSNNNIFSDNKYLDLILLCDEENLAEDVEAKLTIEISDDENSLFETYISTARISKDKYFLFTIEKKYNENVTTKRDIEQQYFYDIQSMGWPFRNKLKNVTMGVVFYNRNGEVISTQNLSAPSF